MNKEMKMAHSGKSLGQSLDDLRNELASATTDILILRQLDMDNDTRILALEKSNEVLKKQITNLTLKIRRNRAKAVFGFLGTAGLLYILSKGYDSLYKRIDKLEKDSETPEKEEESDG